MNHFYIITNTGKDPNLEVTRDIKSFLENRGVECMMESEGPIPPETECVLVLGGDGTILQASKMVEGMDIPLLGINLGTLGYLTELDMSNAMTGLSHLIEHGYAGIEERMMLEGTIYHHGKPVFTGIALNDIFLGRVSGFKILRFNVFVNGEFLNSYAADGMIIATPTGSTAYNLSVGGPIVDPKAFMIVMTPVAPHAMMNRSIILRDKSVIRMELVSTPGRKQPDALVGFDSDDQVEFLPGDYVEIKKSDRITKILKLNKSGFLETLRHKISSN